jgi:hypothetical protein
MEKALLAQALRQRQHQFEQVPADMIDALSEDAIIDSSLTCAHCGEKQVTPNSSRSASLWPKMPTTFSTSTTN